MDNEEELAVLDVSLDDLGTHLVRKGVRTLIAAGCTISSPIASL